MATFKFELVSPERLVLSTDVDQVDLPGTDGDFGILAGHAPFISTLKTGLIRVRESETTRAIYIRGGFADVSPAGLTVLAEKAVAVADFSDEFVADEIALAEAGVAEARTDEGRATARATLAAVKAALTAAATA
jgi:F-type H+-transporting ATPase subunit epsilon